MNDDRNEKINESEEQNNLELNNGQKKDTVPNDATTKNEPIAPIDDTAKTDDATQSDAVAQDDIVTPVELNTQGSDNKVNDVKTDESQDSTVSGLENVNNNYNFEDSSTDTNKVYDETQKNRQIQDSQNNGNKQDINGTNANSYYKESYKNPNNKKSDAWKYVLISIISSIVGGAILTVMLLVVAPAVQPQLKSFIGNVFPNSTIDSVQPSVGELKRVEIVQSAESAITSVAEKVGPSVVGIRTTYQGSNDLFGAQPAGGEGSGIIISSDGYILTNYHVIEGATNDKTRSINSGAKIEVFLANKIDKPYTATIKGYDSKTDLAVLKINENNLTAIEFGDSDALKVGESAIAFGNPGGLEYMGSVTAGVISGLNRTVQLEGGIKIKLVQTDAAINPGNSGGALVNIKGQLIGVNTIKMVATGFEGLGFAIPANDAKRIADELVKNTFISKPYLGISVDQRYTEEIAKANKMPMGIFVADVEILGAAQKAGIKAEDVITKFNKKAVTTYNELEEEKNKLKPGDVVEIELYRAGTKKTIQVTLGETK
ncbi:MAG TPA: trypsin-like peptidase domain-containing protein [Ruminiclostridium sp.]